MIFGSSRFYNYLEKEAKTNPDLKKSIIGLKSNIERKIVIFINVIKLVKILFSGLTSF
jgi:hypothetical protein